MREHTITITPAEPETTFRDGAYTLVCACGERVTYTGYYFTRVEADRHLRYWEQRNAR